MPTSDVGLDERSEKSLRDARETRAKRGVLLSPDQSRAGYELFPSRFGPEWLRERDGEGLLETMHPHGNRASLPGPPIPA